MKLYRKEVRVVLWALQDGYYEDCIPKSSWVPEEYGEALIGKFATEHPDWNCQLQERYVAV